MGKISVVVGGQYGSEAKGTVTGWLVKNTPGRVAVVRVAGPNAGHTAYDYMGRPWALRQVPVGMVTNPRALGIIADGSEVDLPVLLDEVMRLESAGIKVAGRLWVSSYVTLLTSAHHHAEAGSDLRDKVGSTAKGIGAARADRLMRKADTPTTALQRYASLNDWYLDNYDQDQHHIVGRFQDFRNLDDLFVSGVLPEVLSLMLQDGYHIVIEGTQGNGLGLHRKEYPQVTSSNCRAIDFLAMAGLSPWLPAVEELDVWVVVRAFPIRVAGNSGPLLAETSWGDLGLPEEHTTVTQKVRRVGAWDSELFDDAVFANGGPPTVRVAYTMADQEYPFLSGLTNETFEHTEQAYQALRDINSKTRGLVEYIGTGPNSQLILED